MFRVSLMAWSQTVRPLKAPMLVVAISALLALLFTLATRPSEEIGPRTAGEAKVQLVKDEHALVADLVRTIRDNDEAERLAAAQDRAEMRTLALAEVAKQDTPVPVAQAARTPVRVALPAPRPALAAEPPLQLQVAAVASPSPRQPIVTRARMALATVQQLPGWLRSGVANVTDWAISAPAKAISQLPERRFL
jgi:hypothetical protein